MAGGERVGAMVDTVAEADLGGLRLIETRLEVKSALHGRFRALIGVLGAVDDVAGCCLVGVLVQATVLGPSPSSLQLKDFAVLRSSGLRARIISAAVLIKAGILIGTCIFRGRIPSAAHVSTTTDSRLRLGASPMLPRPYVCAATMCSALSAN